MIYYGDEIGMGDNIYLGDRNGVRTPMQWSADRNAGFSRANPQRLYLPIIIDPEYHYEAINVEAQQNNLNSLLWWTKRLIGLRRSHRAFSRGTLEFLRPLNRHILAFLRSTEEETILVVANLSRFVQCAELDLSAFEGSVPIELFGATRFPAVGKQPYPMMLGPHSFYWFQLSREGAKPVPAQADLPVVRFTSPWRNLSADPAIDQLETILVEFLPASISRPRHGRPVRRVRVTDVVPFNSSQGLVQVLLLESDSPGTKSEKTWLPVALLSEETARNATFEHGTAVIARGDGPEAGWLVDARVLPEFHTDLTTFILSGQRAMGSGVGVTPASTGTRLVGVTSRLAASGPLTPEIPAVRGLNTGGSSLNATLGDQFSLTEFARLEPTPLPEFALGRWLSERQDLPHVPRWLGGLEYHRHREEPLILAALQTWIPADGTAWQDALDELSRFYDRVLALPPEWRIPPGGAAVDLGRQTQSEATEVEGTLGGYLGEVRTIASRLAEVHRAAGAADDLPQFEPEPYSLQSLRSLYQSMRNLMQRVLRDLHQLETQLPEEVQGMAQAVLQRHAEINAIFHRVVERPVQAWRMRIHGDCHLGHIIWAGHDVYFTDFDNPAQSVGENRIKRSPIRDVAGLLHSFDIVSTAALHGVSSRRGQAVGVVRAEDQEVLGGWTEYWRRRVWDTFLAAYRESAAPVSYLAPSDGDFRLLLDVFLLERALADLGHRLATRPAESGLGLHSVLRTLDFARDHSF